MAKKTSHQQINAVESCLSQLSLSAPDGYAIGLHITFSTPSFMFQTYPEAWMTHYTQNGLVLQDPTVLWGFANKGRIDWADLADTSPARVMQQAADFGLPYGLTIAFEDKDSLSIASFASQSRPFSAQEADSLEEVVRRLHEITAPDQNLSDETSEALRALSIKLTQ